VAFTSFATSSPMSDVSMQLTESRSPCVALTAGTPAVMNDWHTLWSVVSFVAFACR